MNKSVKLLSVVFIVIFLMPFAAYSEMWSPDRVRVNLRVGGSVDDGALAPGTMKVKSSGVSITEAGYSDKEIDRANGGLSIQYIMELGLLVGIHLYSTEFTTSVSQSSDWAGTTAGGATGAGTAVAMNAAYGGSGTALGTRKSTTSINFLDLGYFYDMKDIVDGMSISGGLGLPLLGSSSKTEIAYGATGYVLNGGIWAETIEPDEGSALSYFADFGYAFGTHEGIFGLRSVTSSGSATVSETVGIGKVLGKPKFESCGSSMSFFLGYGYIF
jgi:hypothetical protein